MKAPSPLGDNWKNWGEDLVRYLNKTYSMLRYKLTGDNAAQDGVILWDNENGYPVVSEGGEFHQVVLADGRGVFYDTTDQTAAAINTVYAVTFNSTGLSNGISIGAPTSRIVFDEDGLYHISFSVQLTSGNSSLKNTYFWPRVNGVDVPGSTIRVSLKTSGVSVVMSRSGLFQLSAGDYLEACWATDDTNVTIDYSAATAFCPATPSVILLAYRVQK